MSGIRRIVLAAGILAVAALVSVLVGRRGGAEGQRTTVPHLRGLNALKAQWRLQRAGLRLDIGSANAAEVAAGVVIAQHPAAGHRVAESTRVAVRLGRTDTPPAAEWDDFDSGPPDWLSPGARRTGRIRIVDGALELTGNLPWTLFGEAEPLAAASAGTPVDARLEVDVQRTAGVFGAESGLLCATEGDGPYYAFAIDGQFGYTIYRSDRPRPLVPWSSSLGLDRRRDRLAVECRSGGPGLPSTLTMWANGERLASVRDRDGLPLVFFGVYVLPTERGSVRVRFDDFVLQRLSSNSGAADWVVPQLAIAQGRR